MDEIRRVVKAAGMRLMVVGFFRHLVVLAVAGVIALFAALLVQRLFGLTWPWKIIFASAGGAVVLAALVTTIARRKDSLGVARELDERAGLRESLSTAMCVSASEDPWSKAVVETARARAVGVKVGQAVPIEAPRLWPFAIGSVAALALAWFVIPAWDILNILEKKTEVQKQQQELIAAKSQVEENAKKLDAILERAKIQLKDEKPDDAAAAAAKAEELKNPEEVRRAAVKRLSDVADKLNQMKDSEKAQQSEALKDQLRQLKQSSDGPMHEFQRQLARGNFDKAKEELEKMAQQMADGKLSPEQAEKAKQQLQDMAKQMEKIAEEKKALEQALEKQGMTKEQAKDLMKKAASGDPKELQKAMEELKQLSPEQKEQLMKQALAQMKASQQMQQMSENAQKMAQGMQGQQMDQKGTEGMQGMMSELSESEQMQGEMDAAQAALSECKAQMAAMGEAMGEGKDGQSDGRGIGQWREGSSTNRGNGSGGPGHGMGPSPADSPTDFSVKKDKANVNTQDGPIIGSRLVFGEQIRGESRAAFTDAVESSSRAASEALETMQVPRPYHGAVKNYFGTLNDKAAKNQAAKEGKPAEKKPATDAKDAGGK